MLSASDTTAATPITRTIAAPSLTTYAVELQTKVLSRGGRSYTYFDYAKAIRE